MCYRANRNGFVNAKLRIFCQNAKEKQLYNSLGYGLLFKRLIVLENSANMVGIEGLSDFIIKAA